MCTALLAFRCVPYTVFPAYRRATRRMQLSLFATAPEDDDEDMMANACLPWTKEDDEMLQRESNKGASLEDLSAALRRGPQGVKRRLKDISNPDHAAYARLHNLPFTEKLSTFRPCGDCIERVRLYLSIYSSTHLCVSQQTYASIRMCNFAYLKTKIHLTYLYYTTILPPPTIAPSYHAYLCPHHSTILKILWDPSLDDEDFFFVYRDR